VQDLGRGVARRGRGMGRGRGGGGGEAGGGAWCTIMRQPAAVRRYTLVAMTGTSWASGLFGMEKLSNTLCTASIIALIATCCSTRTRARGPAAKILAQLSRTWSWPLSRSPAGCTHTISSSSAHTVIMPSRSQRSSAS
jgi:hypothetical protein